MKRVIRRISLALALVALSACGSGGGGGGGSGGGGTPGIPLAPSMQVLPQSYDFGAVTTGNTPAPLEVTIRNVGNGPLNVGPLDFAPGSSSAFKFDFATAQPCGPAAFTVPALGSCTFRVDFAPPSNGPYAANVQITPTAAAPQAVVAISGTAESVSALTVRINQVTSCPSNDAKAYVSVTDQGGFTVTGLTTTHFTVTEGTSTVNRLVKAEYVADAYKSLAISAVADNSGSITNQPVAYAEMKAGFASLFSALRGNDVGELINFGSVFQITVPFPSPSSTSNATNKVALLDGLTVPWTGGTATRLYDGVHQAVNDTAEQTAYRRAVIVATDGIDQKEGGGLASTTPLADVISNAVSKGVPIFTIGLGDSVNATVLQQLASSTGGVFYRAATSQNLATIYAQLSSLLFQNQYVLTFLNPLPLGTNTSSPLRVDVVGLTGLTGNATSSIIACN